MKPSKFTGVQTPSELSVISQKAFRARELMYFNILGYLPYGIMLCPICMCECASKCRRFYSRNKFLLVEAYLPSNAFYCLLLQTNSEQNLEDNETTNSINDRSAELDYFRIFLFT